MATTSTKYDFVKVNAKPETLRGLALIAAQKNEHIYEAFERLVEKELKSLGIKR